MYTQIIAAKAVCLGEALTDEFKAYGQNVLNNARALVNSMMQNNIDVVSGGTDTHMVLLDISRKSIKGQQLQDVLEQINITTNKNPIPFDSVKPSEWKGLCLRVAAATTRGLDEKDFVSLGRIISAVIEDLGNQNSYSQSGCREAIEKICRQYPIYS